MRKDDRIKVTPANVSLITMQLFTMEIKDIKKEFTAFAYTFTEQLMDDWYQYSQSISSMDTTDRTTVYQLALMQTVNVFIDALKPSAKQKLWKLIQQETKLSHYITYKNHKATLFHTAYSH